jgi:hypothetical protein
MSLWTSLFGPSKFDRLLALMQSQQDIEREDRAATQRLLGSFLEGAKIQADLLKQQYDLWTQPRPEPSVRLMTPAVEAKYEALRDRPATLPPIDLDALLDGLGRDFRAESERRPA